MEIKDLPLNDNVQQCFKKLRIQNEEFTNKRTNEMKNCNHLFVLIEKGVIYPGFHSSDYEYDQNKVECVHCGLTNKFMKLEEYINNSNIIKKPLLWFPYNKRTIETQVFLEEFKHGYFRGGKSFNESVINLISNETLPTSHPGLLYKLALSINSDSSNEELFEIMKELHKLETNQEKLRLQNIEEANDLLHRYKYNKSISLVKRK